MNKKWEKITKNIYRVNQYVDFNINGICWGFINKVRVKKLLEISNCYLYSFVLLVFCENYKE